METKINVAEILKDKPQGTKLYADAFGELEYCSISNDKDPRIFVEAKECTSYSFYNNGKYNKYGEPILFPSKEMRDWNKFAWKKGDVLKNTAYEERVIFDGFLNDDYTYFKGKHPLDCSNKFNITYHEECNCFTGNYRLESKDAAQTYIKTIEEKLGGKLNRETLEVEKAQPEFKNGDILSIQEDEEHYHAILIFKGGTDVYVYFDYFHRGLTYGTKIDENEKFISHLATEEEKQQLFSALEKEGKAWDAEKKMIVNLKPKVDELKPFGKVLVRNDKEDQWSANIFSYQVGDMYYCLGECYWRYCIPYIGNESLLGTTKDVEG